MNKDQYRDEELIEVKVPLHMPYMTSWSDYERIDGSIEIGGAWYNYVKRKVSNDTLYLKCLPNTGKTELQRAKNEYACQANDIPCRQKSKDATFKKGVTLSEYNSPVIRYIICTPVVYLFSIHNRRPVAILNTYIEELYPPPQRHC